MSSNRYSHNSSDKSLRSIPNDVSFSRSAQFKAIKNNSKLAFQRPKQVDSSTPIVEATSQFKNNPVPLEKSTSNRSSRVMHQGDALVFLNLKNSDSGDYQQASVDSAPLHGLDSNTHPVAPQRVSQDYSEQFIVEQKVSTQASQQRINFEWTKLNEGRDQPLGSKESRYQTVPTTIHEEQRAPEVLYRDLPKGTNQDLKSVTSERRASQKEPSRSQRPSEAPQIRIQKRNVPSHKGYKMKPTSREVSQPSRTILHQKSPSNMDPRKSGARNRHLALESSMEKSIDTKSSVIREAHAQHQRSKERIPTSSKKLEAPLLSNRTNNESQSKKFISKEKAKQVKNQHKMNKTIALLNEVYNMPPSLQSYLQPLNQGIPSKGKQGGNPSTQPLMSGSSSKQLLAHHPKSKSKKGRRSENKFKDGDDSPTKSVQKLQAKIEFNNTHYGQTFETIKGGDQTLVTTSWQDIQPSELQVKLRRSHDPSLSSERSAHNQFTSSSPKSRASYRNYDAAQGHQQQAEFRTRPQNVSEYVDAADHPPQQGLPQIRSSLPDDINKQANPLRIALSPMNQQQMTNTFPDLPEAGVVEKKQVTPIASMPLRNQQNISEVSYNPHSIQKNEQSIPSYDEAPSQVGAYDHPQQLAQQDLMRLTSYNQNPTFLPNLEESYQNVKPKPKGSFSGQQAVLQLSNPDAMYQTQNQFGRGKKKKLFNEHFHSAIPTSQGQSRAVPVDQLVYKQSNQKWNFLMGQSSSSFVSQKPKNQILNQIVLYGGDVHEYRNQSIQVKKALQTLEKKRKNLESLNSAVQMPDIKSRVGANSQIVKTSHSKDNVAHQEESHQIQRKTSSKAKGSTMQNFYSPKPRRQLVPAGKKRIENQIIFVRQNYPMFSKTAEESREGSSKDIRKAPIANQHTSQIMKQYSEAPIFNPPAVRLEDQRQKQSKRKKKDSEPMSGGIRVGRDDSMGILSSSNVDSRLQQSDIYNQWSVGKQQSSLLTNYPHLDKQRTDQDQTGKSSVTSNRISPQTAQSRLDKQSSNLWLKGRAPIQQDYQTRGLSSSVMEKHQVPNMVSKDIHNSRFYIQSQLSQKPTPQNLTAPRNTQYTATQRNLSSQISQEFESSQPDLLKLVKVPNPAIREMTASQTSMGKAMSSRQGHSNMSKAQLKQQEISKKVENMPIPLATLVTMKNEHNQTLIQKNKYRQLMGFNLARETTEANQQRGESLKKQKTKPVQRPSFMKLGQQEEPQRKSLRVTEDQEQASTISGAKLTKEGLSTLREIRSVVGKTANIGDDELITLAEDLQRQTIQLDNGETKLIVPSRFSPRAKEDSSLSLAKGLHHQQRKASRPFLGAKKVKVYKLREETKQKKEVRFQLE